jgi:hypothetical protein
MEHSAVKPLTLLLLPIRMNFTTKERKFFKSDDDDGVAETSTNPLNKNSPLLPSQLPKLHLNLLTPHSYYSAAEVYLSTFMFKKLTPTIQIQLLQPNITLFAIILTNSIIQPLHCIASLVG